MPGLIVRKIALERRRLAFVGVLAFLAGVLFYARSDHALLGGSACLTAGLLYLCVVVPLALIFCIAAPRSRFLIEAVAVARCLAALVVFTFPPLSDVMAAAPFLTGAFIVTIGMVLSRTVLHGRLRRPKARGLKARAKVMVTRLPARIERPTALQRRFVTWIDATPPVAA